MANISHSGIPFGLSPLITASVNTDLNLHILTVESECVTTVIQPHLSGGTITVITPSEIRSLRCVIDHIHPKLLHMTHVKCTSSVNFFHAINKQDMYIPPPPPFGTHFELLSVSVL